MHVEGMVTVAKERPIIFRKDMLQAILEGRKTQTRRPFKEQPLSEEGEYLSIECDVYSPVKVDRYGEEYPGPEIFGAYSLDGEWGIACPYGKPGDLLWTRTDYRTKRIDSPCLLEITGIRVEQVQSISEPDAILEGFGAEPISPAINFEIAWRAMYGVDNPKAWDRNPFVWVIDFKRVAT